MFSYFSKTENTNIKQISPAKKGDFITCMEYYPANGGWLIVGHASGQIAAWTLQKRSTFLSLNSDEPSDNFDEQYYKKSLKDLVSKERDKREPLSPRRRMFRDGEYFGRLLRSGGNSEAARHIYVDGKKIAAIIGFTSAFIWRDLRAKEDKIPFAKLSQTIFAMGSRAYLTVWKGIVRVYIVDRGNQKSKRLGPVFNLKLEASEPKPTITPLDHGSQVLCSDENRILVLKMLDDGSKRLYVLSVDCSETIHEVYFPRRAKSYWGFQLQGNLMSYISQQNVIKIYDLNLGKVICKLKGHNNCIVTYQFDEDLHIFSLGSDRRICVWAPAEENSWICNKVFRGIPGKFVPSNPYSLVRRGNLLFYHTDFGCFRVDLEDSLSRNI